MNLSINNSVISSGLLFSFKLVKKKKMILLANMIIDFFKKSSFRVLKLGLTKRIVEF